MTNNPKFYRGHLMVKSKLPEALRALDSENRLYEDRKEVLLEAVKGHYDERVEQLMDEILTQKDEFSAAKYLEEIGSGEAHSNSGAWGEVNVYDNPIYAPGLQRNDRIQR
ncbi:MAG: hypothetical protein V5A72_00430 [Candidatus Nanohaloarchaea archaeon]